MIATPERAAVVVLAGGSGSRMGGDVNKVYLPLAGRRVVSWSFVWAARVAEVRSLVLVVRPEDADLARRVLRDDVPSLAVDVVAGGATRHESEEAALAHLAPQVNGGALQVIAVHDGARPLAGVGMFGSVIAAAARVGGALPTLPATEVFELVGQDLLVPAVPSCTLTRVQTPQAFRARELLAAYAAAGRAGYQGTDTASSVATFSDLVVQAVPGRAENLKITYPDDVLRAERILAANDYLMA